VLYNELKRAGKVTEMFRLPGVSHEPFCAGLALRVQRAEAILDWMDRWLRPGGDKGAGKSAGVAD